MHWFLTTLQTILTFALMFTLLVFFHELGHFSAAKWLKMRVEEFAFGLPIPGTKRLFRFAFDGQTEYTVWPVLAGGFVRIKGMEIEDFGDEADTEAENGMTRTEITDARVQYQVGNNTVPSTPLTMNQSTPAMDTAFDKMGENTAEAEPFPTTGANLLMQEAQEVSGADPDGFNNRPIRHRFAVIAAGPLFSFIFGWLVLCSTGMIAGVPDSARLVIGEVQKDSVAAKSGLQNGDAILSINGRTLEMDAALLTIQTSAGKPLVFSLRSVDGATRQVTATPEASQLSGETKPVGRLGFVLDGETLTSHRVGPVESFKNGTLMTRNWFVLMGSIVKSGQVKDTLGGPVRIFKETKKASRRGLADTMGLTAMLSLSLGLFNLFPIPVLDGGHLLLMGVEFVRGKKLTGQQTARVLTSGFIFLALMTVVILFKDIFGR